MTTIKMHEHEVLTDVALVQRLLAAQFPQWADLHITPVKSSGTDNAMYRLGNDMVVRLPRIDWAVHGVEREHEWLPRLAPLLPLTITTPIAKGKPGEGYPWDWSIYRWLEGENATLDQLADPNRTAMDLAAFMLALQRIDPTDGPPAAQHNLRGLPPAIRDAATRNAIAEMGNMVDADAALKVWDSALKAPAWSRPPVWFHGDLSRMNLLFKHGHLSAVIDWGGMAVGDPACDLIIAWNLFDAVSRDTFRKALGVDDATWARGRGHALSQAVMFVPYYLNTNPVGVQNALNAIDAVLADYRANG